MRFYRKVYNTYTERALRLMGYVLYDKMQVYPTVQYRHWFGRQKEEQSKYQYVKRRYGRVSEYSTYHKEYYLLPYT